MYAIRYTRCTGETGVFSTRYESKRQARHAKYDLCHMKDADAYEYEIIEISNSAKITN